MRSGWNVLLRDFRVEIDYQQGLSLPTGTPSPKMALAI
jgi:hypothetical protein